MTTDEKPNFKTCFAYNSALECSCAVLTEKLCDTRGNCPFFKTKEQFDNDAMIADIMHARNLNKKRSKARKNNNDR